MFEDEIEEEDLQELYEDESDNVSLLVFLPWRVNIVRNLHGSAWPPSD
jgi:hypothetical protein